MLVTNGRLKWIGALVMAVGLSASLLPTPVSTQSVDQASQVLTNPDVIGPVAPYTYAGDVRNLPRAPQWSAGDPVFEPEALLGLEVLRASWVAELQLDQVVGSVG